MRVKRFAGVLISTVVLAFTQNSDAQEKIEISKSCFDDFLQLYWSEAYDAGFSAIWNRAFDTRDRMENNIYDVETESEYNGAIQITNNIIKLYRDDETLQGIDKLYGRLEGKYDLPEGQVLHSLEKRVRESDC